MKNKLMTTKENKELYTTKELSAVMGDDKFPTFWVSENVVNTLLETE